MKKGFTLIELMIVVVIIGILAAIAIPNFARIIDRAKEASVKANMHTVQVTVEELSVDYAGRYPGGSGIDSIQAKLPGKFVNPFNKAGNSLVSGMAAAPGEVGYVSDGTVDLFDGTYYTISGFGKTALIEQDGAPFYLTSGN